MIRFMIFMVVPVSLVFLSLSCDRNTKPQNTAKNAELQSVTDIKAGETYLHPVTGKKMILVPTGFIQANWPSSSVGGDPTMHDKNGRLVGSLISLGLWQHFVTGFFIDSTEVTNAEYLHYLETTKSQMPTSWKGNRPSGNQLNYPVKATYEEAQSYAKWAGLRLPSFREYCAAAADKDGVYPWRKDKIYTEQDGPVGSKKEDVSPLGIYDLVCNAEWGSDNFKAEGVMLQLAFCFFQQDDKDNKSVISWATAYLSDDHNNHISFRCVDDFIAIRALAQRRPVGKDIWPEAPKTAMCKVTIKNKLQSEAIVMISNGQIVNIATNEPKTIQLPIGTYVVTFKTTAKKKQIMRFWRCKLNEQQLGTTLLGQEDQGRSYEWTLTETSGEEVSQNR